MTGKAAKHLSKIKVGGRWIKRLKRIAKKLANRIARRLLDPGSGLMPRPRISHLRSLSFPLPSRAADHAGDDHDQPAGATQRPHAPGKTRADFTLTTNCHPCPQSGGRGQAYRKDDP